MYKGFEITNTGYHKTDKCVWWEGVELTSDSIVIARTKKDLMARIDALIKSKEIVYCY